MLAEFDQTRGGWAAVCWAAGDGPAGEVFVLGDNRLGSADCRLEPD